MHHSTKLIRRLRNATHYIFLIKFLTAGIWKSSRFFSLSLVSVERRFTVHKSCLARGSRTRLQKSNGHQQNDFLSSSGFWVKTIVFYSEYFMVWSDLWARESAEDEKIGRLFFITLPFGHGWQHNVMETCMCIVSRAHSPFLMPIGTFPNHTSIK